VLNTQNIKTRYGTADLVLLCLTYLVAFAGAEFVTYYVSPFSGIILHFTILLGLIIHSTLAHDEKRRGLWLALGLVPLIRISGLVIPVPEILEIYWYIIIAIPVFVGVLMIMRNLNYSLDDIGINDKQIPVQVIVAAFGIGLGIIDYFIIKPAALISELNVQLVILPALILLIATGFVEELVFRGVIQRAAHVLGSWGWVYVTLVYTILQIGGGSVTQVAFVFLVSLFFGWIVKKTGSIIGVSISHGLLNIGLYLVFPHLGINFNLPHFF
jgi:membrane protease YdiL (CAAX protease family)